MVTIGGTFSHPATVGEVVICINSDSALPPGATLTQTENATSGSWTWTYPSDDGPSDSTDITVSSKYYFPAGSSPEISTSEEENVYIVIENIAPELSVAGPSILAVGSSSQLTVDTTDPSQSDTLAGFDYTLLQVPTCEFREMGGGMKEVLAIPLF